MFPTPKMHASPLKTHALPAQDCHLTNVALRIQADHGRDRYLQQSQNKNTYPVAAKN